MGKPVESQRSSLNDVKDNDADSLRHKRKCTIIGGIILLIVVLALALGLGLGLGLKSRVATTVYPSESYALIDSYKGSTFFDNFDFFTAADPTEGYVTYVSKQEASSSNFTYVSSASTASGVAPVYISAGKTANYSGVESVRIQSTKNYTQGLFILDLAHMPYGCGTWPAFWTTDVPNNPKNGEIDIIEGVNLQMENRMTLHTNSGCSMPSKNRNETGTILATDCSTTGDSAGCGVEDKTSDASLSYGSGFNGNGGGVYAMDWRTNGIRVWFFPRSDLPSDLTTGSLASGTVPTMLTWGKPVANFPANDCDIGSHFKNHKIVFDLTFCGNWAGAQSIWNASSCYDATKYKVCTDYVHANIGTMSDVFWEINGVYVYQYPGSGATVVG